MRTLIRNIGQIVSGDIRAPLLDGDSIAIEGGRLAAVGRGLDGDADSVIDAGGSTVIPGLIDSHCHPVFGDFTPRQRTMDFIDSGLNGGVTTAISAGEVHLPGRPRDIVGLKALAIVAAKAYANLRPAGVKVHAGAPILELGMVEADFAEMARAGVRLVGEIGLGSVRTGPDAAPMVRWAKQHGMRVTIHTGGPSIAGSSPISAEVVLEAKPHVVGHINGGTTSMSEREIDSLVATAMALEIVHCGNGKTALHTLRRAREAGALDRVIIGNDAPSGTGVVPLGILRVIAHLASLGGVAPELAIAMATGNTARVFDLPVGVLAPGREADLCIVDAPRGLGGPDRSRGPGRRRPLRHLHGPDRRADPHRAEPQHPAGGAGGRGRQGPRPRRRRPLRPSGRARRALGGPARRTRHAHPKAAHRDRGDPGGWWPGRREAGPEGRGGGGDRENPFAGRFVDDLAPLIKVGEELGDLLGRRAVAALGAPVHSYGKAAVVGTDGEYEHAAAILHPTLGTPFRAAVGGGKAIIPSAKKLGGPGTAVDVPLHYKDAAFVRSHFDAVEVRLVDAPRAGEILVALAVTDGGRPHPRVGGLTVAEATKEDGLR